jgi:hypothetical protein
VWADTTRSRCPNIPEMVARGVRTSPKEQSLSRCTPRFCVKQNMIRTSRITDEQFERNSAPITLVYLTLRQFHYLYSTSRVSGSEVTKEGFSVTHVLIRLINFHSIIPIRINIRSYFVWADMSRYSKILNFRSELVVANTFGKFECYEYIYETRTSKFLLGKEPQRF